MNACAVDGCTRRLYAKGMCNTHYMRVRRRGTLDAKPSSTGKPAEERIAERSTYVPFIGCRLWFGASVPQGYGVMFFNGRQQYAHRVAWQLKHGPIPDAMLVMHRCDTPACVNVDHLELGTASDNMQDMMRKGRCRSGAPKGFKHPNPPPRGASNPSAVLTQEQAEAIRRMYATKAYKQWDIAKLFNISQGTVSSVVRREKY